MKLARIFLILVLASSTAIHGQDTTNKTAATKPISALEWLVGGVWTADAAKLGPGLQRIETRYQWSDNGAYIRFTTHFIMDKGTMRNYDGSMFWNAEASKLAIWYMDAGGSIMQGPMTVDGEVFQMTFRATDFEGKMADLRVNVTRKTGDHYNWSLEEKQANGWKQLGTLEYLRTAGV